MAEKYIRSSECEKYFYNHLDDYNIISAMNAIEEMPAADVVEVVRCKDCLLHGNCTTEDSFILSGLCENKSFCCVGKRKGADNG